MSTKSKEYFCLYEVQAVPKLVWPAGGESRSDLAGGQAGSAGCGFTTSGVSPRAGEVGGR